MGTNTAKTLYLSGTFDNPVSVNSSFTHGSSCSANGTNACAGGTSSSAAGTNSLAVGKTTVANGDSSVALGESSVAAHDNTFVWNGNTNQTFSSSEDGTFNINPKNGSKGFFISGKSMDDIIQSNDVDNEEHIWTKKNRFTSTVQMDGSTSFGDGAIVSAVSGAKFNLENATVKMKTLEVSAAETTGNGNIGATVDYVKNKINNFLTLPNTWEGVQTFKQTINGVALKAKWADLAEYYESDRGYDPGTLVKFGGSKEITIASDGVANAVISTKPGLILGDRKNSDYLFIALCGRVPVKVAGTCNKFDKLYLSNDFNGCACTVDNGKEPVGIALESKKDDKCGNVMAVVKMSL